MPPIIKKMNEKYPGIQVFLHETNSSTLRKEVAEGKYDLAIINLPVDETVLDIVPLEPDHLVLAVPNTLLHLIPKKALETKEIDICECPDLPHIVLTQTQEMRHLFNKLCALGLKKGLYTIKNKMDYPFFAYGISVLKVFATDHFDEPESFSNLVSFFAFSKALF